MGNSDGGTNTLITLVGVLITDANEVRDVAINVNHKLATLTDTTMTS